MYEVGLYPKAATSMARKKKKDTGNDKMRFVGNVGGDWREIVEFEGKCCHFVHKNTQ